MFDGHIMTNPELCFMIFTSKEGSEELQISGQYMYNDEPVLSSHTIEVIRR